MKQIAKEFLAAFERRKRVFLIVMDSFGIGAQPDAPLYGDEGSDTLAAVVKQDCFSAPFLSEAGLFNIDGVECGMPSARPIAAYARLRELSAGKDTTTGHWEMAGVVLKRPFPVYPDGFPDEIIAAFERETGYKTLCNKPYSGTEVIKDYGEEQIKTGALIVYTSADSVFQIAAHTCVVPLAELYRCCQIARRLLTGNHAAARVIARPFDGEPPFKRTADRKDFSLAPPHNLLNELKESGLDVIAVGKINDIFCGEGITESVATHGNAEGHAAALKLADRDFHGLCFVNLVDFDMLYGHRNDARGYAAAVSETDAFLRELFHKMKSGDALIVTADHGCDPSAPSTDHSREYVPFLLFGEGIQSRNLGTVDGLSFVGEAVKKLLL